MEFYSVKHREKINVPDNDIKKRKFNSGEGEGRIRYAAVAEVTHKGDSVKLTKFINKATYDELKVPEI
ncbi:MAG: hypothetical protein HXX08_19375 [Chloroflexi bacterium]|uniref:Uncharacterized protein n=1 Tax=Candidatus Chlorohelix allophototropha TaxID=3003348 RepID=A0A8T7M7U5_9CHLR|nr:hypothetical protein [Chloroflexota bacterium]WJW69926.1 hypothetical protein OZ401_003557 [Chloroflexota bacterium L227-S17]